MVITPKAFPLDTWPRRSQPNLPNECWQADFTHWPLVGGAGTAILCWIDVTPGWPCPPPPTTGSPALSSSPRSAPPLPPTDAGLDADGHSSRGVSADATLSDRRYDASG